MTPAQHLASLRVVRDVIAERHRQHAKWGEQTLPFRSYYLGPNAFDLIERQVRVAQDGHKHGWLDVIIEELCEVYRAKTPTERRAELVQLAAVTIQTIEALDREAAKQEAA